MHRTDLYTDVHKGLRKLLFDTAALVARTDFDHDLETAGAVEATRRLLGFLHAHAEHEDAEVVPAIARVAPELAADLAADHARTGGLERELAQLADRLGAAADAERRSLGRRLADRVNGLVAEHLRHMAREESDANRVLWARYDDDALRAIEERIVGAIPPAELADWLVLMLPAMHAGERRARLGGMRAGLPPEAFVAATAAARAALGELAWEAAVGA